ncbi:MAG: type II toxin-antitoxin system MqsA family antitoxin [Planctomycetes bacterium]|nr:type II toxin-antitoxin system MqsA family antitoxin [Planctomycetota bacterium]
MSDTRFPCEECGAQTEAETTKTTFWVEQGLIVIEDIPARVCPQCGEIYYDDETSVAIQQIIAGRPLKPKSRITVPVYSLADIDKDEPG